MFNILISSDLRSWEKGEYAFPVSRFAIEYTRDAISERYKLLDINALDELKEYPALFVVEQEEIASKIGYITDITHDDGFIKINFEIDNSLPEIQKGNLDNFKSELDLGAGELYRTHWAIKNVNLFEVLLKNKLITQEEIKQARLSYNPEPINPEAGERFNKSQIFIVHGHDEVAKLDVEKFVKTLSLEPIVLHMQPNAGMTIVEKIEKHSGVGYAIIIYTPCDIAIKAPDISDNGGQVIFNHRARQNVVFEHGFFVAKLGRERVSVLIKGDVERPSDISGLLFVKMESDKDWEREITIELENLGYPVNV